jgi:hypothetical protein
MPIPLYDASIPVFRRMLANLAHILDKAEAHARAQGQDVDALMEVRFAPDMFPLSRQIQITCDGAKNSAARLIGETPPKVPDVEATWGELKERVVKTIAYLEGFKAEQFEGRETSTIELPLPNRTLTFSGVDFVFSFALPNFFFHYVTTYDLLRSQGVPLGKADYLAGAQAM